MCKIGDIIVVEKYIGEDGKELKKHSFIVIDNTQGNISGLNYDLVTNVMSSFKNKEYKKRKIKYKENLPIVCDDIKSVNKNNKEGYIKADQLIYFKKNKLKYYVFAKVEPELLDKLIKLIIELRVENKLKMNTRNLID